MPDLKQQFFAGGGDLPAAWRERLTTASYGLGLRDTLTKLGWSGQPCATVCLVLSADGLRITNGSFALWGELSDEPIEVPTSKLWEGTPRGATLHIRGLTGQVFSFNGGMLHSEYLDSNKFELAFSKAGQPILSQDWANNNLGNISLRAIAHLDKTSNRSGKPRIKYTVIAALMSADELVELSERTQHVSWPGIKILEGHAEFFPTAENTPWGAPFFPLLCCRERPDDSVTCPPGDHIRFALAEIMRSAALPTACVTRGALNEKGQEILDADSEPEARGPSITWPPVERPPPDRGKGFININLRDGHRLARSDRPVHIKIPKFPLFTRKMQGEEEMRTYNGLLKAIKYR